MVKKTLDIALEEYVLVLRLNREDLVEINNVISVLRSVDGLLYLFIMRILAT